MSEKDKEICKRTGSNKNYREEALVIVVVGASGDLAKKKTYPSLFDLYINDLLPSKVLIWGFARSQMTNEEFRLKLKPFISKKSKDHCDVETSDSKIDEFLSLCLYKKAKSYGDEEAYRYINDQIKGLLEYSGVEGYNKLFYFALPPNVFAEAGAAIKKAILTVDKSNILSADKSDTFWNRVIVEKPFGRDLESCKLLLKQLSKSFEEKQLYRIDHYLGKEMVQNIKVMRFSNLWYERLFNRDCVKCVLITFKEPFGTQGRGGYFDNYGIIRDIIQNHLLQVMSLVTMEPPSRIEGPLASSLVRDAKVNVLGAINPITMDDVFLGQYEGYTDDPTITNKDTNTPTFALIRCFINNSRWDGVPIIFKAGKALNERKAELRIQFKDAPADEFLFGAKCPNNELIMRIQPKEAIYMKTNVKTPGFSFDPVQTELEINYATRFAKCNPDAYSRLILDVICGRQSHFVRDDELIKSWEIFTPILHEIEEGNTKCAQYKSGSRGPEGADDWVEQKSGYRRNDDYQYSL